MRQYYPSRRFLARLAVPLGAALIVDQEVLKQHLAQAQQHVDLGERRVAQLRELVAKLERDGRDPAQAKKLLSSFEKSLAQHVVDRDRIRRELAAVRP